MHLEAVSAASHSGRRKVPDTLRWPIENATGRLRADLPKAEKAQDKDDDDDEADNVNDAVHVHFLCELLSRTARQVTLIILGRGGNVCALPHPILLGCAKQGDRRSDCGDFWASASPALNAGFREVRQSAVGRLPTSAVGQQRTLIHRGLTRANTITANYRSARFTRLGRSAVRT